MRVLMDCKGPELVVLLQEDNCQVFRDVRLDEEVSSRGCSVENCELDHKNNSCLLNFKVEKEVTSSTEAPDPVSSLSNCSKSLSELDCIDNAVKQCSSEALLKEEKANLCANVETTDACFPKNTVSNGVVKELVTYYSRLQASNSIRDRGELKNNEDTCKKTVLANRSVSSASEAFKNNSHSSDADNKTDDMGSKDMTQDSDPSTATMSSREESPEREDCEQHIKTKSSMLSRVEDGISEKLVLSLPRQNSTGLDPDHEEDSFSSASPSSRLLVESGPTPYSGNVSLRSNSSTASASARSFAFPILQSEWKDSPVRMAKADRKHSKRRKHWRWLRHLLCCKC